MAYFMNRLGHALRETGQALDRVGCHFQGSMACVEELSRHRPIMSVWPHIPAVDPSDFIAPSASVIGDVKLGKNASVWYGAVVRGDDAPISVGDNTNLQDGVVVRSNPATVGHKRMGSTIGHNVTVGHGAVLSGVTIEDEVLIGIGATLAEGVQVKKGAMIAAGAVVPANTMVPGGQVWGGNPAKYLRDLKPEEAAFIPVSARKYVELAAQHAKVAAKTPMQRLGR